MPEFLIDTNLIAATALVNNLNLATRNKEDFKDVEGLEVYNPFS